MMVVFDLDDTLYYERDFERSGWDAVARYIAGQDIDINGKWTEDMLNVYRCHKPALTLRADALTALQYLKTHGITIGIITDGRSITQRNKFEALDLGRFVDEPNLIISEEVGGDKLTGGPFEEMMRRNPDEKSYMYIGDNPQKDFVVAKRMGWQTVMLLDTAHRNVHSQTKPDDSAHCPDFTIESLTTLHSKIEDK